jgi:hypothetical protein
MTTEQALKHFKTQQALADALGIKQSSVAEWGEYPPPLRQVQLEMLTSKKLRAEPGVMPAKEASA